MISSLKAHSVTKTLTKETQTDYCILNNDELVNILFYSLNSSTCDAEIQTNIIIREVAKNNKIILQKVEHNMKDACIGPDRSTVTGFTGYQDIQNDRDMKSFCGVIVVVFNVLLKFIHAKAFNQPRFYRTLSAENRLVLFLMKMKLGLSFVALACIFKVSNKTASRIFFNILDTLHCTTETWLFWPSREVVRKRLPKLFKNYPNCRAIIDYTEISTDCPPTVEQKIQMYSSNKGGFMVKYLRAITPSGLISFVSKGYGGRSSDDFITNDSGFLNLLEPGDLILANKEFPIIKSKMLKRQCLLDTPPFAVNPQFSEREEVLEGCSIASVRIHIERAIERVKIFKILDHINVECLPYLDKIMRVACILANNKEPLISDMDN